MESRTQIFRRMRTGMISLLVSFMLASCEKEITVDLPPSQQQYVVEATINTAFPNLNYVFISKSLDYFNPDLSLGGIKGAEVYITEGVITGTDTVFPDSKKLRLVDISTLPGFDSIFNDISGIYFNYSVAGKVNTSYRLDITLPDGSYITGRTHIPALVPIDSVKYEIKKDGNNDGKRDAYVSLYYFDPPEQNNYRMALYNYTDSIMPGWGAADSYRTFDDQLLNGIQRPVTYNRPFEEGDTLNFFFNSIGRKEFLFWQSFGSASNNGGPFATPVSVKSNITGAIGSFTGYACSFKQVILR